MAERVLSLQYPHRGLNRRFSIQHPPDYSTLDSLNMRPFDPIEERQRGGPRPGLSTYLNLRDGPPDFPVNMLADINVSGEEEITPARFMDDFRYGSDAGWTFSNTRTTHGVGLLRTPGVQVGEISRELPGNLDSGSEYTVQVSMPGILPPLPGNIRGLDGVVRLDLGLDAETIFREGPWNRIELVARYIIPLPTIDLLPVTELEVSLIHMEGRHEVRRVWSDSAVSPRGWNIWDLLMSVRVFPDNIVTIRMASNPDFWNITSPDLGLGQSSGRFVAIGLQRGATDALWEHSPIVRWFLIDYFVRSPPIFPTPQALLVAAVNGKVTLQKDENTLLNPVDDALLDQKAKPLMAVDAIAPSGGSLATPPTPGPNRQPGIRLFIADYTSDPTVGPKVYDPKTNKLIAWEADFYPDGRRKGVGPTGLPMGNPIMVRFGGRIYLAGNPPHAWYASRTSGEESDSDPFDWDFGENIFQGGEDPAAAISGQAAEVGDISEPLRALMPFVDDYLIFATANRLFRLPGDPGFGARIVSLSDEVGVAGPQAWCTTPEGAVLLMDQERGLFGLKPGATSFPLPISSEVLPRELRDIDVRDVIVQLAYDHRQPGVHIFLTSISGRQLEHWWFDRRTGGFWPFSLVDQYLPSTVFAYQSTAPDRSGVLLGGRDGVIRRFDNPAPLDDGVPFEQYIVYGPFNLAGGDYLEGVLRWIRGTLPTTGNGLSFEVRTGPTAADALDDDSPLQRRFAGRFGADSRERKAVRLRGVVAFVKIIGGRSPWAIETLDASVEPLAAARA
jgi:hypothetical protein